MYKLLTNVANKMFGKNVTNALCFLFNMLFFTFFVIYDILYQLRKSQSESAKFVANLSHLSL